MDTLSRINKVRDTMSINAFAKTIGVDAGNLNRCINGKSSISDYILLKISHAFNISLDWLKTGEGEMYDTTPRPMSTQEMMAVTNKYGMHVVGDNAVQNNTGSIPTASLEAEIAALKARLEEKDKQIEMLMEIIKNK